MSSGWTPLKRRTVEDAFYAYLGRCFIVSKDHGRISLGEHLYPGQVQLITEIFDALENDIHKIYILKSRQLGISTIIRALVVFLLGIHEGLQGAIVFDQDLTKNKARTETESVIKALPKSLKFPGIAKNNRTGIILDNNSEVLFMSAGVRRSKSSGTLGRSMALTICHNSELCSWDNPEGLEALEHCYSEIHPDRLYIYESTARGYNKWNEMWKEARKDPHHCKCIFLGWWSKDSQSIPEGTLDFKLYGEAPPTEEENAKIKLVKELYGVDISKSQLAWIRRKMNPAATGESPDDGNEEDDPERIQEQPWIEEEAFQQTGSVFFPAKQLTDQTNRWVNDKYKRWFYQAGAEFVDMRVYEANTLKMTDLKVWEEPDPEGVYVLGCDPAYGENENNDRSSIQILRCYADGVDQVAEYASPLINTRQLAWVIASLLGWYGQQRAEIRYILELNGPGTAVFNELKSLKFQIENSIAKDVNEGLRDVFRNVRTYIYTRPDGMGQGGNYHFKTNANLKVTLMERLRDFVSNGTLRIRSRAAVDEMKTIARDGDSISAPSSMRDDCVLALALSTYFWETSIRKQLLVQKRTRESEAARMQMSVTNQVYLFNQNTLADYMKAKQQGRYRQQQMDRRASWRYGVRR